MFAYVWVIVIPFSQTLRERLDSVLELEELTIAYAFLQLAVLAYDLRWNIVLEVLIEKLVHLLILQQLIYRRVLPQD